MEGTEFGRYRLLELVGRGGMGEVWRAHDSGTDRIVAIKVLPASLSGDDMFQQRFRREAHAAARLNTPHVIPIHDYGEIDGRLYVSMRFVEGRDLQSLLTNGPLEPARAVRIIEQVAKALHAAHKVGLVHRDVKPSNILLDDDDFAYLIDFGIAGAMDETRLTSTGNAIGTFHYMAPERFGGRRDEDARTDIYALACVLYECLTGQPPFAGESVGSLVAAHLNTPPPPPSTRQPNLPRQLDNVIATGMAKSPDRRYATTVELASAAHNAITAPIPRPPEPVVYTRPNVPAPQPSPPQAPYQPRPLFAQSPATFTPPAQPRSRRKAALITAAALLIVVALAAAVTFVVIARSRTTTSPTSKPGSQTVLPFKDLNNPWGVTVDTKDTVYVADTYNWQVVALEAGSTTPTVLPFKNLASLSGAAVARDGTLYVAEFTGNRVISLPAGATTQTALPFIQLDSARGVAVDSRGTVYVASFATNEVVALPAGSSSQTKLPIDLIGPTSVAVDSSDTLYVSAFDKVVSLPRGSTSQTVLPFTGLQSPEGIAVDSKRTVYVADTQNNRVVSLAAGSTNPTVLPFTGLNKPQGVAVDSTGAVYVSDTQNNRVVKLTPE